MKKTVAIIAIAGVLVSTWSVAHAGITDERVPINSPTTTAAYTVRYSCPGGTLQTSAEKTASGSVEVQAGLTIAGEESTLGFTLTGTEFASPLFASSTLGPLLEAELTWADRFADGAPFEQLATQQIVCDNYATLPASTFVPIAPQRVLDTRPGTRIGHQGGKPGENSVVNIPISALPDIPSTAVALSATVTATESTAAGFVELLPGGGTPGRTSTVNPRFAGHTLANNAVTTLTPDGVDVFNRIGGHVLVDVNGYFVASAGAETAGRLQTITPTRVLDTRDASRIGHVGGKPGAGTTLTIDVDALDSVANGEVSAAVVNITATETSAPGFLQAARAGELVPGASSVLNTGAAGETIAGLSIVPVSADGAFDLFTSGGSHLLVDVIGYFTNETAVASVEGRFVPITPERVMDTRVASSVNYGEPYGVSDRDLVTGLRAAGSEVLVTLEGIEPWATAVMMNVTAVETQGPGFLQVGASRTLDVGSASNVNFTDAGVIVANAVISEITQNEVNGSDGVDIHVSSGGHVLADLAGFFEAAPNG